MKTLVKSLALILAIILLTVSASATSIELPEDFFGDDSSNEITPPKPTPNPNPNPNEWKNPFSDVIKGKWYYEGIEFVNTKGLMIGVSDTSFEPNSKTNRAMLVTVLYRLEGSPSVKYTNKFSDIKDNKWYTNPVLWAEKNKIVEGIGDGKFAPNDDITREQMATIMYRYAKFKGYNTSTTKDISSFKDNAKVAAYAKSAIKWAYGVSLINGVGDNLLDPKGYATRAQISVIVQRFCTNIVK